MVLGLNAYFSVCSKEKMKAAIFRLMTLAIVSMFFATLLLLLLQLNLSRDDPITSLGEFIANMAQVTFLVLDKFGYYMAATIRTRALLQKFPKTLNCLYVMLIICIINQFVIFGFLADLLTRMYNATPETFYQDLPGIQDALVRYQKQAAFTSIFDMVFANALAVSFLYPIFTTLEMDLLPAIKAMIKLGDVQKVIVFSASSIVCVSLVLGLPDPQLSLAVLTVWLNTQNTQFLHLSYFSSSQLLVTHSKASSYARQHLTSNTPRNWELIKQRV